MKAAFPWVIGLVMVIVAGTPPALAIADGPDYYAVSGVSLGNVLNIRATPSADGNQIGAIPHDGRGIRNLGCRGGPTFEEWQRMNAAERDQAARQRWCRVRYHDVEGWVAGWHLREDAGPPHD